MEETEGEVIEKIVTEKGESDFQLSVEKVNKYLQIKWNVCYLVFVLAFIFFLPWTCNYSPFQKSVSIADLI